MRGFAPPAIHTLLAIGAAIAAAGCGVGDVVTPFTVRDSAGVQIVESRLCSWDEQPWTIALSPEVRAGRGGPGSDTHLLGISDARRLADGRIVAADQELGRLRLFSPDGEHLLSVGRAGDGPSEFRSLDRLLEWRERLWVFDVRSSRLTSLAATGALDQEIELAAFRSAQPIGDVLAIGGQLFGMRANGKPTYPTFQARGQDTVHIFGLEPETAESVFSFPGSLFFGLPRIRSSQPAAWFTPVPSWATDGSSLYLSSGDRFEFSVADGAGRTTRIVRRAEPPPPVTDAEVARWRASQLDGVPDSERRTIENHLARWKLPETLPTYVELLVDVSGNVWARRRGEGAQEWEVFRSDGACLGRVQAPAGLRLLEVGEDHVLGAYAEHADQEYVQLHRLLR